MMDEERDLELLENFLSGNLPETELDEVKVRLEIDPVLREMKDELLQLKSGIEAVGRKNLKEKMNTWDSELENPLKSLEAKSEVKVINWKAYISWAAVLVVGFFAIFSWYTSDGQKTRRLYGAYFEVFDNVIVPTQRGGDIKDLKTRVFGFYDIGEYEKAKPLFEELTKEDAAEYILFYQGMTLMALGDWAEAEEVLSRIKSDFLLQANWYRALNALRQQDFEKARELLQRLELGNNSYSKKATEILRKLD